MTTIEKSYALTDLHVVDVVAGRAVAGQAVVVGDGRIVDVIAEDTVEAEIPKVPLGGRYLSPGLIDCHAHCFVGQFGDRGNVLPSEMTARAGHHLAGMLGQVCGLTQACRGDWTRPQLGWIGPDSAHQMWHSLGLTGSCCRKEQGHQRHSLYRWTTDCRAA